jgi:F0F1-type ATP synthase membrane subunit b/b'
MTPNTTKTRNVSTSEDHTDNVTNLSEQAFLNSYYLSLAQLESCNLEVITAQQEREWHKSQLNKACSLALQIDVQIPSNNLPDVNSFSREKTNLALDNIRRGVTKYKDIKENFEKKKTRLQKELETTKTQLQKELETTKTQLQKELETTKTQLQKELETTKTQLQKELETTKTQLQKELETTKTQLQKELETTKTQLQKELETTKTQLQNELDSTISDLNKRLQDANKAFIESTNKLEKLKTQKMVEILIIIGAGILTVLMFHNIISVLFIMLATWWIRSNFWL